MTNFAAPFTRFDIRLRQNSTWTVPVTHGEKGDERQTGIGPAGRATDQFFSPIKKLSLAGSLRIDHWSREREGAERANGRRGQGRQLR